MNRIRHNIFYLLYLLLGVSAVMSCRNEADVADVKGGLRVLLNNVSTSTLTRATPTEIGKPVTNKFSLKVTDANGLAKYDGKYTEELIRLVGGEYTVTATYGENPILATDAPYYVGTTSVDVEDGKEVEASIKCTVGNALISIIFGKNDAERERFDKFYETYGINVKVAGYTVSIPSTASTMSAYFRAGSKAELEFYGVLKANGREVSTTLDLSSTSFPQAFKAADHAIVTLTLPDPESATVIDISKVEIVEATLEETIPLSWLPIPQATAEHQYDANGELVGTDVTFSNSYPGMEWKAVVTDADGTEYRTIQGTGSLSSTYSDNTEGWPYLPAGNYTATYYLVQDGQEPQKTGSRTFTVANPNLKVTVDGYTSYSKYLEGNVDAANACDAFTIYAPSAKMNVSPSLLSNSKYTYSLTTSLNGSPLSGAQSGNTFTYNNQTGKTPSFEAYTIACSATFDKTTATDSKNVYITGLPVTFAPPTQDTGWYVASNKVSWNDDNVQLGQMAGSGSHSIEYNKFAIPAGTKMECPYKVRMHGATVATTLTLSVGGGDSYMEYFKETSSSGAFNSKNHDYESVAKLTSKGLTETSKAHSSYGSGQTYSVIYSLSYKYGK